MLMVYEAIVAAQMKMRVLGLAYVSNMATGIYNKPLSHVEVFENGEKVSVSISKKVKNIVRFQKPIICHVVYEIGTKYHYVVLRSTKARI
jgi:hypothetical protein